MATSLAVNKKIEIFITDCDLAHQIVHGSVETTVATEGGPVDSFAKLMKRLEDSFITGAGGINAAVQRAEQARDKAMEWAEGDTEPGGPGTKSAKAWAEEARQNAGGGGAGSGDVSGPNSSLGGEIAVFEGVTGKLIKGSGTTITSITTNIEAKQPILQSGQNIKTINGQSLLGSGNISTAGEVADVSGPSSSIDGEFALFSGLTGKIIKRSGISPADKQDKLVSGSNIKTIGGMTILGSGDIPLNQGGASAKLKIAVLGDSLSARTNILNESWPGLLEDSLRGGGIECEVVNLAVIGHTFNDANTAPVYGGETQVQRAITLKADIVIVALGANDTVTGEARTIAQVKADAQQTFSSLRNGLPGATLIYGSEVTWDSTHKGAGTGLQNRDVCTYLQNLPSSGILAGCYGSEILDSQVSATIAARIPRWIELDNYIKGLPTVNGFIPFNQFRAARLGLIGADGVHPTSEGARMFCGYARQSFNTLPVLSARVPGLRSTNYPSYDNPDSVFDLFCVSSGGTWVDRAQDSVAMHISSNHLMLQGIRPASWYMPTKGSLSFGESTITPYNVLTWQVRNAAPGNAVKLSSNGGGWTATPFITDPMGNVDSVHLHGGLALGTTVWRVKIGSEVYGPFSVNVQAGNISADVSGPSSSIDGEFALFSGLTGKIIKRSGVSPADKQDKLVAGTNLRLIAGQSLLGSGEIPIANAVRFEHPGFTISGATPITFNSWNQAEAGGDGVTHSSGVFSLPYGLWMVVAHVALSSGNASNSYQIRLHKSSEAAVPEIAGNSAPFTSPFLGLTLSGFVPGGSYTLRLHAGSATGVVTSTDRLTFIKFKRVV